MAAPSEEKLICDKFNLEALTVNQDYRLISKTAKVTYRCLYFGNSQERQFHIL